MPKGRFYSEDSEPARLEFFDDLEVWVSRRDVRTARLSVKPPDGRIEVVAPWYVTDRELASFVRQKRDWIVRKQAEVASSRMSLASAASPEEVRLWREVVESFAPPLVAKWEKVMGVKAGKLAYRNMKSRWGSCQPATGRICLNVRLALYPPECLEYVVVHELAHLIVRGHGPDFHRMMDGFLPNWREARAKLRD